MADLNGIIQVDNPANKPMHYGDKYILGAVYPPDYIPKYTLYSYSEGEKMYNDMQYDIYMNSKKAKPKKKKGFPKIFKILTGAALGILGCIGIKKGIEKIITKFKR